jgi:HK97 family phage prohead protease
MTIEKRYLRGVELRQSEDGKPIITGHAAVFDSPWDQRMSEFFGFEETIAPGAFRNSLADPNVDVRALFNHDSNYVLGRFAPSKNVRTLQMTEDSQGLFSHFTPPATRESETVLTLLRDGLVDAMSFAFEVVAQEWRREGGVVTRRITEAKLSDVSVVTYPAYPATDVGTRTIFGAAPDIESQEIQKVLSEYGGIPTDGRRLRLRLRELTFKRVRN